MIFRVLRVLLGFWGDLKGFKGVFRVLGWIFKDFEECFKVLGIFKGFGGILRFLRGILGLSLINI